MALIVGRFKSGICRRTSAGKRPSNASLPPPRDGGAPGGDLSGLVSSHGGHALRRHFAARHPTVSARRRQVARAREPRGRPAAALRQFVRACDWAARREARGLMNELLILVGICGVLGLGAWMVERPRRGGDLHADGQAGGGDGGGGTRNT